jgi:hypothetical protein
MVIKRQISKGKYIIAFVISASIFIIGLLLGTLIADSKLNSINDLQQRIRTQVFSVETQYNLALQNPCSLIDSSELTKDLYKISDDLGALEADLGKNNKDVLELSSYYSILETRHWMFMKEAAKRCGKDYKLILFFYSNNLDKCADCDTQGFVLTHIRKKYTNQSIYIYSYNVDIDNGVIQTLMRLYNVKKLPTIVINDKSYNGSKDSTELEKILGLG